MMSDCVYTRERKPLVKQLIPCALYRDYDYYTQLIAGVILTLHTTLLLLLLLRRRFVLSLVMCINETYIEVFDTALWPPSESLICTRQLCSQPALYPFFLFLSCVARLCSECFSHARALCQCWIREIVELNWSSTSRTRNDWPPNSNDCYFVVWFDWINN